jgi:hypothetical protein
MSSSWGVVLAGAGCGADERAAGTGLAGPVAGRRGLDVPPERAGAADHAEGVTDAAT